MLETGTVLATNSNEWTCIDAEDRACLYLPLRRSAGQEMHGPAVSEEDMKYCIASDHLPGLRCRSWPACASGWLIRQRHHNWPSQEQIDQCKSLGCFFVSVSHPFSNEKHLQYRISFLLQERLLVTSFNAVQLKCYILLKMIQKEKIDKIVGKKSLTSYHFKTCMLYLIENTPAEFWRNENLLVCLHNCLKQMLVCVEKRDCPNYFIPGENMFEGRISGRMQNKLSDVLRRILSADFKFLLDIKSGDLGNEFQRALVQKELTAQEHEKRTLINLYELSHLLFSCVLHNRDDIFNSCHNTSIPKVRSELYMIKCKLQTTRRVTEHSLTETQEALSLLLPYIDTTWMSVQIVEAKHSSVSNECIYDLLTSEN